MGQVWNNFSIKLNNETVQSFEDVAYVDTNTHKYQSAGIKLDWFL